MLSPERSRIRSCPKRSIQTFVLCPSLLLSNENLALLHFFANAEIIFAYILVFPACVIEVQHIAVKIIGLILLTILLPSVVFIRQQVI